MVAAGLAWALLCAPHARAQTEKEQAVLTRFATLRASNVESTNEGLWIQATNHTQKCEVFLSGVVDPPVNLEWLGDCRAGRASGLGLAITKSAQGKTITLGEYVEELAEVVGYRQVKVDSLGASIIKGRFMRGESAFEVLAVAKSPKDNVTAVSGNEYCHGGECIRSMVDPLTGTVTHRLAGSGYMIEWLDLRAENKPLFTRRALWMDGVIPVEKHVLDGGVYDFYRDLHSGQVHRVAFSDGINRVLALPMERAASVAGNIESAVREANRKFAAVFERFCRAQKNPDIRTFCDPSPLIPDDEALASARAELNESARASYTQNQRTAAIHKGQMAQAALAHAEYQQAQAHVAEQQRQARALATEQQRQAGQEALRRGLDAINQAGQAAQRAGQQMQQSYGVPQVQNSTIHHTGIVHCRTIGYITTCN